MAQLYTCLSNIINAMFIQQLIEEFSHLFKILRESAYQEAVSSIRNPTTRHAVLKGSK
jgi:hypothetical protein